MSYYTVVAVALGVACALAYSLYSTFNNAPRAQRYPSSNNNRRLQDNSGSSTAPRKCGICNKHVHTDLRFSCGHQFHKSCMLRQSCRRECYSCSKLLSPTERWITTESEDFAICTICQYSIDQLSIVLKCGHEFHRHCASQMLQYEERRCPNCREHLTSSDLRGILLGGSTLQ